MSRRTVPGIRFCSASNEIEQALWTPRDGSTVYYWGVEKSI